MGKQQKAQVELKWADEQVGQPIPRTEAARIIRGNRNQPRELRIQVRRKYGETYIASDFLGVGCVIYRAALSEPQA